MDLKKTDEVLEQKCRQTLCTATDNVTRFKCLALRKGCNGISSIARKFKIMDDDRNHTLSFEEFVKGCHDLLDLKDRDIRVLKELFDEFDLNGDGTMNFDEFLLAVRPKMNEFRMKLVEQTFAIMDTNGNGVVEVEDIAQTYNVSQHPKFQNGSWTKKQVLEEFLKHFQGNVEIPDDQVTLDEWKDYFRGVSASIDDDPYFQLMINTCWHKKAPKKGTSHLF